MKTVIEMARQSGYGDHMSVLHAPALERFAELIRADERERIKTANAPEIEKINAHIKEIEHQAARYAVLRTWRFDGYDYGLDSPEEIDKAVDGCIKDHT